MGISKIEDNNLRYVLRAYEHRFRRAIHRWNRTDGCFSNLIWGQKELTSRFHVFSVLAVYGLRPWLVLRVWASYELSIDCCFKTLLEIQFSCDETWQVKLLFSLFLMTRYCWCGITWNLSRDQESIASRMWQIGFRSVMVIAWVTGFNVLKNEELSKMLEQQCSSTAECQDQLAFDYYTAPCNWNQKINLV